MDNSKNSLDKVQVESSSSCFYDTFVFGHYSLCEPNPFPGNLDFMHKKKKPQDTLSSLLKNLLWGKLSFLHQGGLLGLICLFLTYPSLKKQFSHPVLHSLNCCLLLRENSSNLC